MFYAGDHYDSLIPRDAEEALQICKRKYWKVKSKDFIKKEESKLIRKKMMIDLQMIIQQIQQMNYLDQYQIIETMVAIQKKITDIKDKKNVKKQNDASED